MTPSLYHMPSAVEKWIKDAPKAAFLLDFDGTMVHLAANPDAVIVPPDLIDNLKTITQNSALSFAIVTGRALSKLDMLMAGLTTVAIGSHGAEWRPHPSAAIEILAPILPSALRQAMNAVAIAHECIFEDKLYTISMHLPFERINLDLMPDLRTALGTLADNYVIRKIGRTYEVLQKTIHKGSGIRHLMSQPAFAGKWPVYIGDDVGTDVTLTAVDELGGICLGVSNHAPNQEPHNSAFMGIDSVGWIVQALAQL